jgi:hypothetical protein
MVMPKYKYTLARGESISLRPSEINYSNVTSFLGDWLRTGTDSYFTYIYIPEGYSWDGCSPKFKLFGKFIGSPDFGNKTKIASLVHDALYQYAGLHSIPKDKCDFIFLSLMKREKFIFSKFYFYAVKYFGFISWNKYMNMNLGKPI